MDLLVWHYTIESAITVRELELLEPFRLDGQVELDMIFSNVTMNTPVHVIKIITDSLKVFANN